MPRLNLTEAETQALILDEADRLFTDIGFDKTTVADIAKACGFSSANVHRVFGTKHAINCAIAGRKLSAKIAAARAAVQDARNPAEKICAFVRTVHVLTTETINDNKRVHDMVTRAIQDEWEEVRRYRLELLAIAREIIAEGAASGAFDVDDVDRAAKAFHTSAMGFFHPMAVADLMVYPDRCDVEDWLPFALKALGAQVPDEA